MYEWILNKLKTVHNSGIIVALVWASCSRCHKRLQYVIGTICSKFYSFDLNIVVGF